MWIWDDKNYGAVGQKERKVITMEMWGRKGMYWLKIWKTIYLPKHITNNGILSATNALYCYIYFVLENRYLYKNFVHLKCYMYYIHQFDSNKLMYNQNIFTFSYFIDLWEKYICDLSSMYFLYKLAYYVTQETCCLKLAVLSCMNEAISKYGLKSLKVIVMNLVNFTYL